MRPARVLIGAAGGLLLLVAAVAAVPRLLDWDRYRDNVAAIASAGLGRPVRIDGPLRLVLLPQVLLVASAVTLGDGGDGTGATVTAMRLRIGLGALLSGQIDVQELALDGADIRLPWPPAPGIVGTRPPAWLTGLHARLQASHLHVGALDISDIDGELASDPQSGALSASGLANVLGRRWRIVGRLGQPGGDGSATLAIAVDGQGPARDTGGTLSGQLALDGSLSGRVAARGPDLSLLLAAPAQPWRAEGRLTTGGGLAVADDLDVQVGASPARGAVALRLLPAIRLDVALAASRLDADAWLPPLLHGNATAFPMGVDLSAEAATLAGGTVRRLRAGFDLATDGVTIRDAEAILPGDAALHLSGQVIANRFTGSGSLDAPDVPETLRWLQPRARALVAAVPVGAVHAASLSGVVAADASTLALSGVQGKLDGAPVSADLAVQAGDRPAIAITASLADTVLDPWLPDRIATTPAALATWLIALPTRFSGFDADLALTLTRPVLHGTVLDNAALDGRAQDGTVELRRVSLDGDDVAASLSGVFGPGGRLTDVVLDASTRHAAVAAPVLPALQGLLHGPATLHVTGSGELGALAMTVAADLADAQLRLTGRADLPRRQWAGAVTLRHPGAPRLLAALGLPNTAAWLGDGSFSLVADVDAAPDRIAATGLAVSAGALRTGADLVLAGLGAGQPSLSGTIVADTVTLPLPYAYSPAPWPTQWLQGWQARLGVKAGHVLLGLSPVMDDAAAALTLADGALRVDKLTAQVAGGMLAADATLDTASPPRVSLAGTLTGAVITGPLLDGPVDLTAGQLDARVRLTGSGYSPAAVLATLSGPLWITVRDGKLAGLDARAALTAAAGADPPAIPAAVTAALLGGATPFTQLEAAAAFDHGTATLTQGALAVPGGTGALSGTADLPGGAIDLRLALRKGDGTAPSFGLRVIGPAAAPRRTPEVAELARYLASQ